MIQEEEEYTRRIGRKIDAEEWKKIKKEQEEEGYEEEGFF